MFPLLLENATSVYHFCCVITSKNATIISRCMLQKNPSCLVSICFCNVGCFGHICWKRFFVLLQHDTLQYLAANNDVSLFAKKIVQNVTTFLWHFAFADYIHMKGVTKCSCISKNVIFFFWKCYIFTIDLQLVKPLCLYIIWFPILPLAKKLNT
jgi:hypothetical protein